MRALIQFGYNLPDQTQPIATDRSVRNRISLDQLTSLLPYACTVDERVLGKLC